MIDEAKTAILLGRSLTAAETTNFETYLNIATEHLEQLLCVDLSQPDSAEDRTYGTRDGYRTVYVDYFTDVNSITRDGDTVDADDYTIKQNDRFNGSWYNIIEFDKRQTGKNIVVNADWGFGDNVPDDLAMLLALLFNQVSLDQVTDGQVKSKKIEDFAVTYKDSTTLKDLLGANSAVIEKYSQCNQGAIRHGRVHSVYYR
jgi:hypothetical protein